MQTALTAKGLSPATAIIARGPQPSRSTETFTAQVGLVRTYDKDEEIFAEGDRAAYLYKVTSGVVRTSKLLSDGRRQIDAFHLAGDIFGIEAGDEYRFCAEAVGPCTVTAYRRSNLDAMAEHESQQITLAMMRALVRAQNHLLLLGRKTALEKIATFLLDLADRMPGSDAIDLPMSRIDIADHLGLTIETVSRSLTQLERQSVIELLSARRIVLSNKAALQRLNA